MIVFFLPDLRGGGAERVMLNLLTEFHKDSEKEVVLLLGRKQGPLMDQVPEGIRVFELEAGSAMKSLIPFVRFCQKHRPKKVIASLGSSLAAAMAKPFIPKGIEIINRLGNTIGAEKLLFKSTLKRRLYIRANKLIAQKSDKIIFQCHYMAEDFIREVGVQPKSYKYIYNPVDVTNMVKKSGELIEEDFDFVSIGRLSPQKDYLTLLQAVRILVKEHQKDFKFLILGGGEQREILENKIEIFEIEKNVFLKGFTKNPYPYMKKAKALISTSLYEGFSNVIVEALTLGVPVIASDCPGANHEVIRQGKDGFLFEVGSGAALAKLILEEENSLLHLDRNDIKGTAIDRFNQKRIFQEYAEYIDQ